MNMCHPESAVVDLSIINPMARRLAGSLQVAVRLSKILHSENQLQSDDAQLFKHNLPCLLDMISDELSYLAEEIDRADEGQPKSIASVADELKARLRMLTRIDRQKFWDDFGAGAVADAATANKAA
jgi:hypothetical protein